MKHNIQISYMQTFRSHWEVEAPDEETAMNMASAALYFSEDETDTCRRTVRPDDYMDFEIEEVQVKPVALAFLTTVER